ncbi:MULTISPECIES: WGR domain-containing protein [Thiothrix]|uniref:WGR domain-containing protein n=1 Tax=Thiothrix TaxID=1030 RepID=UPI00257B7D29|nr:MULTISPECIES: WGR domain-containing protein [Thiothrix]MDX9987387.1 WGR domain-containing protein [Thiothrix unzii]
MNNSISQSWSHAVKRRYYRVDIAPDLFGDLCMVRSWGSLDTARGNSKMELVPCWQVATQRLEQIAKERLRRGYNQMLAIGQVE